MKTQHWFITVGIIALTVFNLLVVTLTNTIPFTPGALTILASAVVLVFCVIDAFEFYPWKKE